MPYYRLGRLSILTFVAALAMSALPAFAQVEGSTATPSAAPSNVTPEHPEIAQKARGYFKKGLEHFQARSFRAAIRDFELAAQLVPSADLWYNVARAHEELSEFSQAVDYYRKYLRDRVDPPDRQQIERHIKSLEEKVEAERSVQRKQPTTGTLRLSGVPNDAKLSVDRRRLSPQQRQNDTGKVSSVEASNMPELPLGLSRQAIQLSLPPGDHQLQVEKSEYIPFRAVTRLEPGLTTAAYPDLVPATQYRSVRGRPLWTWIVGSLAVAALATGLGLSIKAATSSGDQRTDYSRYSDYALGAGLGLSVGTVIAYFVESRAVETKRIVGPQHPTLTPKASR